MLDALGNLGDFIGGIGVVVTLAYLAVQIRQNTRVVQTSNFQDMMARTTHFSTPLIQDESTADLYRRGLASYAQLSETEKLRFSMIVNELFTTSQLGFHMRNRQLIDDALYDNYMQSFMQMLRTPGVREWWRAQRGWYHADFRAFVDGKLREAEAKTSELSFRVD